VPLFGRDPALLPLGSTSGGRRLFREAGIAVPDGAEDLADEADVAEALAALKGRNPDLRRAVVKLNEGFSGEGNAVFRFEGAPAGRALGRWVRARLPALAFEAAAMSWDAYRAKLREMGGIVEAFVEGDGKRSPSAQYRIDPLGDVEVISTHDQVLGGRSGQIFLGCRFPADDAYRVEIQAAGLKTARILRDRGVLGRFAVDFLSVPDGAGWQHYAIEINLRKGGTTHPFLMLQYLTDGRYDPATGTYHTPSGRPCCYYASDNLQSARYRGLTPDDLIEIAVLNGLHFHGATQEGVVFHLIGALSEFGKLGLVCVAATPERAGRLYEHTQAVLDRESPEP
ncbi:MAG TPA: peptide ligase PGM1-related protein, partial [Geminicoccaceae bacterium]|nr:peptide ligase PGM1-related protein [Geminicoccaceae bacterium]